MKKQLSPTPATPAVAYSYIRFSTSEQRKGDSLRRQTEEAAAWCARNNVPLDTATTLHDLGKSAYTGKHRENPDRHALAAFLKLVEAGKVPRGSFLVIENLDRLSREHIQPALLLALNLLQAGVRIVQLKPAEMVFDHRSDTLPVMMMMMELSRGHGESAIKSERVGAAWRAKKALARQGKPMGARIPAWVERRDGRLVAIPQRAAVVRRIFELTACGYGLSSVVKTMIADKVPPFRAGGHWSRSYISLILRDRRVLGEFQPRFVNGQPDGELIRDYYPRIVTEEEWAAARAGSQQRNHRPGRIGGRANLFAGLLKNARDGDTFFLSDKGRGPGGRLLINSAGSEARAPYQTFPADVFEESILTHLREIDPHEILNGDSGPDETQVLAGQLAQVEADIARLEAVLLEGDVQAVARVLRVKEAEKKQVVEELARARQEAANPLSESWGQAQSLAAALNAAPDQADARLRLRSALRRIVAGIWVLIVGRGRHKLAGVQVWFAGEKRRRDYLLWYESAAGGPNRPRRPARRGSVSLAAVAGPADLDLRKRDHARRLEKVLAEMELPTELESDGGGAVQ
jgi:DNA invertase Pin-like site-specific DNA recombinase